MDLVNQSNGGNRQVPVLPAFLRGASEDNVSGQYYPTSGYLYDEGETLLDRMRANEYERQREHQPYYPFMDEGEWELAKFLALNHTQTEMNQFLKLKWVGPLSDFNCYY